MAKFIKSRKCSWLALQEKKQIPQLLEDAAKQDVQKGTLKVNKKLKRNDDRLLEFAVYVDKWSKCSDKRISGSIDL